MILYCNIGIVLKPYYYIQNYDKKKPLPLIFMYMHYDQGGLIKVKPRLSMSIVICDYLWDFSIKIEYFTVIFKFNLC